MHLPLFYGAISPTGAWDRARSAIKCVFFHCCAFGLIANVEHWDENRAPWGTVIFSTPKWHTKQRHKGGKALVQRYYHYHPSAAVKEVVRSACKDHFNINKFQKWSRVNVTCIVCECVLHFPVIIASFCTVRSVLLYLCFTPLLLWCLFYHLPLLFYIILCSLLECNSSASICVSCFDVAHLKYKVLFYAIFP